MNRAGLPILAYHSLDTSGSVISTDPVWFAETMRILVASGFRTVDLADWLARGRPVLERAFAITFDDGLRSVLEAVDVLTEYQLHATAFLVTDRVGSNNV